MPKKRSSAGGSAMHAGARYQNQVAAWLATKMLAERPGDPIAPRGQIRYLSSESGEAVDDILAGTDLGWHVFVQAKRKIPFSSLENSDLASVVNQIVRQINSPAEPAKRPWSRPLDPTGDRILLVTSSDSPATLKTHLRATLRRVSGLDPAQDINEAAIPQQEVDALNTFLSHVRREWLKESGVAPTNAEIRNLLALFDIEVLDPGDGERDERESKGDLRSVVLKDPSQEHLAWTTLVSFCGRMADERTGFDLARLRTDLRDDGVELLALPSFASDITALREYTKTTLGLLKKLSRIEMGGKELKVERQAVTSLVQIADQVSTVVIGLPGAGKSGVIHDTARRLLDEDRDVICLAVDLLELTSLSRLQEDLFLKHPVIEVIKAWDGAKKGVILIDALDAARGESAADTILSLIQLLKHETRWNVIASVRKWDLRNSPSLRETFRYAQHASAAADLSDPEFSDVNHLSIPVFSTEELDGICAQSPELQSLQNAASPIMLELLRVPFNLRLAADMLDHGMTPAEFSPLRDQVGLLQAYWDRRVTPIPGGDNRERVLRACLSDMVGTRRLRTARATAAATGEANALKELLSRNVLSEWQSSSAGAPNRQLLAFSHNVLFDFGAEELFLNHEPDDFVKQLEEHPDLALLLRPSLHMRFQRLWMTDKPGFWDLTFKMCSMESLPALLKSCPLVVVAENATVTEDVEILSRELKLKPSDQRPGAADAYTHLVGVLVSGGKDNKPHLGENAGPWQHLAVDAMTPVGGYQLGDVQLWLDAALQHWGTQTREQMDTLGTLSRAVLERVWAFENRNGGWAVAAIKNVCTTYGSDIEASGALLRRALEEEHLKEYGHEELRPIVGEVVRFAHIDPAFTQDVYVAAFSWREAAEDPTFLDKSRLGSLLSTKRQDYDHRRWDLAQRYSRYLEVAAWSAIQVVFPIVEAYCREEHNTGSQVEAFQLAGFTAGIRDDYSSIWDSNWFGDENAFAIVNEFFRYVKEIAENNQAVALLAAIVKVFILSAKDAVLWRRLLELASTHPSLAHQIRDAAWAQPLLMAPDTMRQMHKFIQTVHPTLDTTEREKLEDAIMALGDLGSNTVGPARRDRYLGALSSEHIVTATAKHRIAELAAASALKQETPEEYRVSGVAVAIDPEQFYAMRGIGTDGPANKELVDIQRPVRAFSGTTIESALEIMPAMKALRQAIDNGDATTRNEELTHTAFGHLVEASAKIAKIDQLIPSSELGLLVKKTLIGGASAHWPATGASDEEFEGGWSSLAGRIDAAEGLFALVLNQAFDPEELFPPILQLAHDPLPVVRFQVARHVGYFHDRLPDRMWELISRLSSDPNYRNRTAIVGTLEDLARAYPERALTQIVSILDNASTALGKSDELTQFCVTCLTQYYAWRADPTAEAALNRILNALPGSAVEATKMIHPLRDALKYVEPANPERARGTRERSARVFNAIVSGSVPPMRKLIARKLRRDDLTEKEETEFGELEHLLVVCAGELYFAVGAFNEQSHILRAVITMPEQPEMYHALSSSWDQLTEIGSPKLVHKLIESLELFIPIDPETVFLRIGRAAQAGKLWRYQQESQAAELIVRIVRSYIADHRSIFQRNADCLRVLREVLDLFISAGWPSARLLSYRVDEVFR